MAVEQHDAGRGAGTPQESRRVPEEGRSTPLVTPPMRPRHEGDQRQARRPADDGAREARGGPVEPVERLAVTVEHTEHDRQGELLLDIPRLEVDELSLELEATALLRQVRLDVKNLQLGVLLRADVEQLAQLVSARRDDDHGPSRAGRVATAAYDRLFGADRERPQLEPGDDEPVEAEERPSSTRLGRVAKEGGKAAAVAAAGLAGGALVESRLEPLRNLGVDLPRPLRRRESAPRAALRRVTRALPI